MSHHELPASVRVALWGTEVLAGRLAVDDLPDRALPDVDSCFGLVERVRLWGEVGERAVLVALPRPGDLAGMPQGSPELVAAATRAEECVYVPGVGGALVPDLEPFGPEGDQGWAARWTSFEAEPVATHRVEALDLGQTELELRRELVDLTDELARRGSPPFGAAADRGLARARLAGTSGWGVPDGLLPRAVRVIDLAGTVLQLADAGLDAVSGSLDSASAVGRSDLLRRLQAHAARALADATNAAVLQRAYRV